MKAIKHLSLIFALLLFVLAGFPVAGAGATGNSDTEEKQEAKEEKQEEKAENNNEKKDDGAVNAEQVTGTPSEPVEEAKKEPAIEEEKKEKESESVSQTVTKVKASTSDSIPTKKAETDPVKDNPNKSTQIHLHLKNCVSPVASVFVELNGEWKQMSNPGNSPLYKLLDGGEFVKDDITSFKLVFTSGEELVVPVSDVKVGVEANGTINYWLEKCELPVGDGDPGKDNSNKSTQIHLHLKNCVSPVASVFVELNGEWKQMSNPGNSPLYKLLDGGEFVKDDITSFKLVFTSGQELVVPVSELKVGVEANGSVNYWLEKCDLPVIEKDVFHTLNLQIDESSGKIDTAVLIMMNGKRMEFKRINNVFTIVLDEEIDFEMVRGIELTSNGKTKGFLLSQLDSGLVKLAGDVATLELNWDMQGTMVESETEDENDAQPVPVANSNSGSAGSAGTKVWAGDVLPKTGEESRAMYYVLGLLLSAAGVFIRFRNPLKN